MKDDPEKWDPQEIREWWVYKDPRDRQAPGDPQGETEI